MPSRKELKEALDLAFRHDAQAVVEPCISDGVEVTCTVHDITGDELLEVTRCHLLEKLSLRKSYSKTHIKFFL